MTKVNTRKESVKVVFVFESVDGGQAETFLTPILTFRSLVSFNLLRCTDY